MLCVGFDGYVITDDLKRLIDRGIGAVILFRRNFQNALQVIQLCHAIKQYARRAILIGVDQEGGRVIRFGEPFSQTPSLRTIGKTGDIGHAKRIGEILGAELRAAHIDINFAPVMDVDTNPANPVIGVRSFGNSAQRVSAMGVAMIEGLQSAGVAACAKHFPGHGDTSQDSHLDLPRLSHGMDRLMQVELQPFFAAAKADVAAIMTSHVIFDAVDRILPATMSRAIIHDILRQQIGFDRVIVSDDLEMHAISKHFPLEQVVEQTVNAGIDLITICHSAEKQNRAIDLLLHAVQSGRVKEEMIASANQRLDVLMDRFAQTAGESAPVQIPPVIGCNEHRDFLRPFAEGGVGSDPTEK